MKKWVAMLLVISLCGALSACGAPEAPAEPPATTQATEAPATAPDYLALAQEALLREDRTAAISLLEHGLAEGEDPRLQSLLAELTAPTPLILEFSNDSEEVIAVHSFTAEQTYTQEIRYTLDYTAPEGLAVHLSGGMLDAAIPDFVTTGQPGQLVFEADAADIRNMQGRFQVQLRTPEDTAYTLDVRTLWPDQIQTAYEISYLHVDHDRTNNALVHSFLLTDLGDTYHFTVTYTAIAGLQIEGQFETPEEQYLLWEEVLYTEGGEGILEFDIEKALFAKGKYMEICFLGPSEQWVAAGFDFPMHLRRTLAEPQGESIPSGYLLSPNGWGGDFEVHDCHYQHLSNGFVRFTLDLTAPAGSFVTISAESGTGSQMLDQYLSLPGRQQYVFDVPKEILARVRNLSVLVAQPFSTSRYLEIPCGSFAADATATPLEDPTEMDFTVMEKPSIPDFQVLSAQVQPLSNGSVRYTVTLQADEAMKATVFDPPNGEALLLLYNSQPEAGIHTLCFDLEPAAAAALTEITVNGNFSGGKHFSAVFFNPLAGIPMESIPVTILSCR